MAADSGMDTCPSPEIADSRKRPLDGDTENGDTKRSHFSSGNSLVLIELTARSVEIPRRKQMTFAVLLSVIELGEFLGIVCVFGGYNTCAA